MSHPQWTSLAAAFRRSALPLASYYAVTLAGPLANGAAGSDGTFIKHALVVSIVPPISIVLTYAVRTIVRMAVMPGVAWLSERAAHALPPPESIRTERVTKQLFTGRLGRGALHLNARRSRRNAASISPYE